MCHSGLPRWIGVVPIHGRREVAAHQRISFVNRTCGCRNISSSKASLDRAVSCRVGPCRATHRFFRAAHTNLRRTQSALRAPLVIMRILTLAHAHRPCTVFITRACRGSVIRPPPPRFETKRRWLSRKEQWITLDEYSQLVVRLLILGQYLTQ